MSSSDSPPHDHDVVLVTVMQSKVSNFTTADDYITASFSNGLDLLCVKEGGRVREREREREREKGKGEREEREREEVDNFAKLQASCIVPVL